MGCVKTCDCNFSMSNTGTDCSPAMEVVKKLMLMPVYDSTGVRNYIDLTDDIDASTFTDLINDPDSSKRLYPLPEMKDIEDTRANPILQTFKDGSNIFIRDDARQFKGIIPGKDGNTILKGKIEAARCGEVGVFMVDRVGSLIGTISDDGTKLYPTRIDSESLAAIFGKATDTTVQQLMISFNFDPDESDSCLRMVTKSEMDDADLLILKGLIDVYAIYTGAATTGVTVKLYTDYGTPKTPTTVKGLTTTDFVSSTDAATSKVRNETDSANIAVTVTESTDEPGTYDLAWAAQTPADVMIIKPLKDGFDFKEVVTSKVTIPT